MGGPRLWLRIGVGACLLCWVTVAVLMVVLTLMLAGSAR